MNKSNFKNILLQILVLSLSLWNTIESRHLFLCKTTNLSIYKKKNKLLGIFLISARLIDVKKMLAGKKRGGV